MRYFFAIIAAVVLMNIADAQVHVNLNINVGQQPVWGPVGYDYVEYYYLPDIDAYYYVPQHKYFYFDRGRWVSGVSLPPRYRGYDLYHSYKVVVNEPTPYRHDEIYRQKYVSYKGRHDQQVIRDSHDSKYFINKDHPEHNNWVRQQHDNGGEKHDNGRRGHDNGNDKHDNGRRGHDNGDDREKDHR